MVLEIIPEGEHFWLEHFKLFDCPFEQLSETEREAIRGEIEEYVSQRIRLAEGRGYASSLCGCNFYNTEMLNLFPILYPELISVEQFLAWMNWGVIDLSIVDAGMADSPLKQSPSTYPEGRSLSLLCSFLYTLITSVSDGIEFNLDSLKVMIESYNVPINFEFEQFTERASLLQLALQCNLPLEAIQYLLSRGADPYIENHGGNALYYAINHPDDAVLELLLNKFTDLVLESKSFLIWLACEPYNPPGIHRLKLLLELGCDAGTRGSNSLHTNVSPFRRLFLSADHPISQRTIDAAMFLFQYCSDYGEALPAPKRPGTTVLSMLSSSVEISRPLIALIRQRQSLEENIDDMECCGSYSEDEAY